MTERERSASSSSLSSRSSDVGSRAAEVEIQCCAAAGLPIRPEAIAEDEARRQRKLGELRLKNAKEEQIKMQAVLDTMDETARQQYEEFQDRARRVCKGEIIWSNSAIVHLTNECDIIYRESAERFILSDTLWNEWPLCPSCLNLVVNDPEHERYRRAVRRQENIKFGSVYDAFKYMPVYTSGQFFHMFGLEHEGAPLASSMEGKEGNELKERLERDLSRAANHRRHKKTSKRWLSKKRAAKRRVAKLRSIPICPICYEMVWNVFELREFSEAAFPLQNGASLS